MTAGAAFFAGLALGAALAGGGAWYAHKRYKKRLGRFLSFAAHEVNSPATAINMTIINFLNGVFGEVSKDHLRWLELLRSQTHRMSAILGEIRDWIHWEITGDLVIMTAETSVQEAIDHSMESLREAITGNEKPIELDIPSDLPPVIADGDRLSRTVSSLLLHARKFRSSGGIKIKGAHQGSTVTLTFEYQGEKISEAEARESLEPYYPAYEKHGDLLCAVGTGLGVIKGLNRHQGGDLDLAVDPEGRTRLILSIPAKMVD